MKGLLPPLSYLLAVTLSLACGSSKEIPEAEAKPVRIADARARLVGYRETSCTHQRGLASDEHRWCGFTLGAVPEQPNELWVIDVTAAATGDVPDCNGTDPGCINLTTTLAPRAGASFFGDTLIYHVDPVSGPNDEFLGRIFAWRPGWSVGRQISSDRGFTCIGQLQSSAAACFDDPEGDPNIRDSAEVRIGYLDDPEGGALPAIGRWPLRNDNEAAWQAAFSPDGTNFGLSSAAIIGAQESLEVLATKNAGKTAPTLALEDVKAWQISNDGASIYFVRGLPLQTDLYVADFPSGNHVRLIEPGILSFTRIGDKANDQALGFVKEIDATEREYRLLSQHLQADPKSIFSYESVLESARVSPDLRYTVWTDFAFRARVVRNSDLFSCLINEDAEPPVYDPMFLDHAAMMFWKELRPDDPTRRDAFMAAPNHCRSKTLLARDIDFFTPLGDRGLVFADQFDPQTELATLKYIALSSDGKSLDDSGPVRIHRGVSSPIVLIGNDPLLLLYSVVGSSEAKTGLFVYGPVPF